MLITEALQGTNSLLSGTRKVGAETRKIAIERDRSGVGTQMTLGDLIQVRVLFDRLVILSYPDSFSDDDNERGHHGFGSSPQEPTPIRVPQSSQAVDPFENFRRAQSAGFNQRLKAAFQTQPR